MRGLMQGMNIPDLTDEQANRVVNYAAAAFPPVQPYDGNSRLPRTLLTGKAVNYRLVTYDLENKYAEPHDVAMDPQGNAWVGRRWWRRSARSVTTKSASFCWRASARPWRCRRW
jgi:hypothetical protein